MEVAGKKPEQEARQRGDFDVEVSRSSFLCYQGIILPLHEDWIGTGERKAEQDYSVSLLYFF